MIVDEYAITASKLRNIADKVVGIVAFVGKAEKQLIRRYNIYDHDPRYEGKLTQAEYSQGYRQEIMQHGSDAYIVYDNVKSSSNSNKHASCYVIDISDSMPMFFTNYIYSFSDLKAKNGEIKVQDNTRVGYDITQLYLENNDRIRASNSENKGPRVVIPAEYARLKNLIMPMEESAGWFVPNQKEVSEMDVLPVRSSLKALSKVRSDVKDLDTSSTYWTVTPIGSSDLRLMQVWQVKDGASAPLWISQNKKRAAMVRLFICL